MQKTFAPATTDRALDGLDEQLRALDAEGPLVVDEAEALDPSARARLVEKLVVDYMAVAPPAAAVIRPRRWWILGPVGIAAGLGIVIFGGERGPVTLADADVEVSSGVRSEPSSLRQVAAGQPFFLRCRVPGAAFEAVSIRARRVDPGRTEETPRTLGFIIDSAAADRAVLYTIADLPEGDWELTCGVRDARGHFQWLQPPTRLVVV